VTFRVLDRLVDDDGTKLLADIMFAGSPHSVLDDKPDSWLLAWFEAGQVRSVQPVVDALADDVTDQIDAAGPTARGPSREDLR
jgi:hypothetical protein